MPQLTDEQYNALMSDHQIANAARKLWDDPRTGPEAKALLKKGMPEVVIPEHDIRVEMQNEFAARDKRIADEREAERIAKEDSFWKQKRKETQDSFGIPEDRMKEMEKWMWENNVGSYEVAATYHAAKNPKPSEPTGSGYKDPYWNHGKSDLFKEIAKDPEEWGRSEIMKALTNDQAKLRGGF